MFHERNVENSQKIEILQLLIKFQNQSVLPLGSKLKGRYFPATHIPLFLILFLVFVELNIEVQIIMKEFD